MTFGYDANVIGLGVVSTETIPALRRQIDEHSIESVGCTLTIRTEQQADHFFCHSLGGLICEAVGMKGWLAASNI